jgi:Mitochondrial carrier protein
MLDWRESAAGVFGALCLVAVGAPFDALKTRVQTGASRGVVVGMRDLARERALLALWKGSGAAVWSAVTENSVVFAMNGLFRRFFAAGRSESELTVSEHLLSGMLSGVFSSASIIVPEVVKVRMQSAPRLYRSPLRCAIDVARKEGAASLFAGLPALMARDVPFNAIFFGCYAFYRRALDPYTPSPTLAHLLCGGGAGATAWAVVFPVDVIKSRLAVRPTSTNLAEFRAVLDAHGPLGFYRGSSAALLRAFIANAALFAGYEFASTQLGAHRQM